MTDINITLTGIDERTNLLDIQNIIHKHKGVEFAVLLADNPEARHRYPSIGFIDKAVNILQDRLAVHVCGSAARASLLCGRYEHIFSRVGRIQINGKLTVDEVNSAIKLYPKQQIITQHTAANASLLSVVQQELTSHALLIDGSGGRGISPESWQAPITTKPVGFAGGLGPLNLPTELRRIIKVAQTGWWIDMETSLRDKEDWFDIGKALAAIKASDMSFIEDDFCS